jgi:inhibitor of KinA
MGETDKPRTRFQIASDQSLLVYFESPHGRRGDKDSRPAKQITIEAHEQVRRFLRLMELEPIAGVRNLHPGYCSVLVKFDAIRMQHSELEETLRSHLAKMAKIALPEPQLVKIPVCYGGEYGPDLEDVAELHGMTAERAIELHVSATYTVYFLGFVPGFAYLGELPTTLATPRLPTPRKIVPPGSVGIAGNQTGVYPVATPGGWRLLGRTPAVMFQPERSEMSLLSIGDRVRFVAISREEFAKLERA